MFILPPFLRSFPQMNQRFYIPQLHPLLARCATPVLLAAGLAACGDAAAPPASPPPPPEVTVITLHPQTVTVTRELAGRASPYLVAEVRPQVNGIVKSRLFTEGSR